MAKRSFQFANPQYGRFRKYRRVSSFVDKSAVTHSSNQYPILIVPARGNRNAVVVQNSPSKLQQTLTRYSTAPIRRRRTYAKKPAAPKRMKSSVKKPTVAQLNRKTKSQLVAFIKKNY